MFSGKIWNFPILFYHINNDIETVILQRIHLWSLIAFIREHHNRSSIPLMIITVVVVVVVVVVNYLVLCQMITVKPCANLDLSAWKIIYAELLLGRQ